MFDQRTAIQLAKDTEKREPKLAVHALHKSFGTLDVLKGVSLEAYHHDVIAILGASGSGKSTFLRCINFLENPTRGTVALNGEVITTRAHTNGDQVPVDPKQIERMRARLAMVFQSFNLWSHMTVLENIIEAPVHVLGVSRSQAIEAAEALLHKVGLYDRKGYYPAYLSGGQQQRVTHEVAFAREASNRVVFLREGKIEEEGDPDTVMARPSSPHFERFLSRARN